jgi:uncharacterized membrane protein
MRKFDFQIADIISDAWRLMLKNLSFFVAIVIIYGLISGGFDFLNFKLGPSLWASFVSLLSLVVTLILVIGIAKISLLIVDQDEVGLSALYRSAGKFFRVLVGQILYGLIVLAGFILLIVPGIIWGIRYSMYLYFIVDKDMGPIEALTASARVTQGYKLQLFLLNLLLGLLNLAGLLALVIGLFFTIPTGWLAQAKAYRILESRGKAE